MIQIKMSIDVFVNLFQQIFLHLLGIKHVNITFNPSVPFTHKEIESYLFLRSLHDETNCKQKGIKYFLFAYKYA